MLNIYRELISITTRDKGFILITLIGNYLSLNSRLKLGYKSFKKVLKW